MPPKLATNKSVILLRLALDRPSIPILALLIGVGVWIYSSLEDWEMTPHHPFRSAEAKERYLKLYDERSKKWPVVSQTRTVSTTYGSTFVRISGPDGAPPLVLLHGGGGNSLHWLPTIAPLSENHRTYAVDNVYDFGRSRYSRIMESPEDMVNWLNESLEALGLEDPVHLVGLSYGGWVASQYALRFPERLNKVILLAPASTVLPLSSEWIQRAVLSVLPHRYFIKSFLFWMLEDMARKDEDSRIQLEEEVDHSFLAMQSFKLKNLVRPTVLTDQELQSLEVPTLFLIGENEKIYSAQKAIERLKRVAPHIETEVIPNAGHDLTWVQTEMVNRKILEFLR